MRTPRWARVDAVAILVVGAACLWPATTRAEWRFPRYDAARTAALPDDAIDGFPDARFTATWRTYLGGSLTALSYLVIDVNRDGVDEVVYVAGGKVLAKLPDDRIVWESEPLELSTLVAVTDVDGDGDLEVLCGAAPSTVFVLDGGNGATTSSVSLEGDAGQRGTFARLLLGDLDGDALPDLFVGEAGCSTLSSGLAFEGYSFAAGAASPTLLFREYEVDAEGRWESHWCGGQGHVLADVDGLGDLEVVLVVHDHAYVYDPRTGEVVASSPSLTASADGGAECEASATNCFWGGHAVTAVADLDGDGADEVALLEDYYRAYDEGGARGFRVLDLVDDTLQIVSRHDTLDRIGDRVVWGTQPIVNLDGAGAPELVIGTQEADVWTLEVRDPLTGDTLASLAGVYPVGTADLDGDGLPEILARDASALHVLEYGGTGLVELAVRTGWGGGVTTVVDAAVPIRTSFREHPATLDLDGDGIAELLVRSGRSLFAATLAAGALEPSRTFELDEDLTVLCAGAHPGVDLGGPVTLATSDGYFLVLDETLSATNAWRTEEFEVRGMRIGGFTTGGIDMGRSPLTADIDADGTDETIVVRDSRGRTLSLDASAASLIEPPGNRFAVSCTYTVIGGFGAAGAPEMLCTSGSQVRRIDPLSGTAGDWIATGLASIWLDALPGHANGDDRDDLYFSDYDSEHGQIVGMNVLDGATLEPLFAESPPQRAQGAGHQPMALRDLDRDGTDDFVAVVNSVLALDVDGPTLIEAAAPERLMYFTPIVYDWDDDDELEMVLQSGHEPVRMVEGPGAADPYFETIWTATGAAPTTDRNGAVALCPDGAMLVHALFASPVLSFLAGGDGTAERLVLAGGLAFASEEEAEAAGLRPGYLGNVNVVGSMPTPDSGNTAVALVGSTDGFLYAVDACSRSILWALDFRYAVGEPIPLDVDGDDRQELVVSVADGFLYGLDREILPAPQNVREVDLLRSGDVDVDQIDTDSTLDVAWDLVEGAASYEYSIRNQGWQPMTDPPWIGAGGETTAHVVDLRLALGQQYFVAVRAMTAEGGASSEGLSDGVVVADLDAPRIELTAAPTDIDALTASEVSLSLTAWDRFGLASVAWQVVGPDGAVVLQLDPVATDGSSASATGVWPLEPDQAAGAYQLVATATDLFDHDAEASLDLNVSRGGSDLDGGADGGADGGVGDDGGCDCAAASATGGLRGMERLLSW